jgi:CRISPR-associated protein (TIGR03986 family)
LHLDADLYRRYVQDQKTILSDKTSGHLTAHPLGNKSNFDVEKIKDSIRAHAEFAPGQLIYVELTTDQNGKTSSRSNVISCGHHFRYRWAYSSSIRQQEGQTRRCLTPIAAEQTDEKPERLSGARLLFGYVRDDKTNRIGEGVFTRLAGRIAINHAVSLGVPRFLGGPSTGYCVPLKILGQPKPSAWEFYLQQPDDLKKPMNTYGDLPGDLGGELAGRKFYRHQPGTKPSDLEAGDDEVIASDQATLARFICQPGTHFRFSIRFARLRDWELGALLAVLEPHHLVSGGKPGDYAHKLGLGRPLGMGSVRLTRQAIRLRQERDVEFMESTKAAKRVSQALQSVKIKLDQTPVQEWLAAHRWQEGQRLGYPESSDGTIYGWHTDIRKDYSRLRRQQDPVWSQLAQKIQRHH